MSEISNDQPTQPAEVPPGLRTDPPPEDGTQIVAWAIDMHGIGFNDPDREPRWMVVQFAPPYRGGKPYWVWSVPGRSTLVKVLGWLPLPALDHFGRMNKEDLEYVR